MRVGGDSRLCDPCPDWGPPRRLLDSRHFHSRHLRLAYDYPEGGPRSLCARPGTAFRRLLERNQHPRRSLACSPFLGPLEMAVLSNKLNTSLSTYSSTMSCSPLITGSAELVLRRISQ